MSASNTTLVYGLCDQHGVPQAIRDAAIFNRDNIQSVYKMALNFAAMQTVLTHLGLQNSADALPNGLTQKAVVAAFSWTWTTFVKKVDLYPWLQQSATLSEQFFSGLFFVCCTYSQLIDLFTTAASLTEQQTQTWQAIWWLWGPGNAINNNLPPSLQSRDAREYAAARVTQADLQAFKDSFS